MSLGLELIGIVSCVLGWLLAIVACALPMWRVTAFIGSNIVTAQIIWDGLWMSCVVQSTGQMQCKVYDSMLALSQDLQAARALTVISILLTVLAVLVSIGGAKCTNCIEEESSKAKVMILGGVLFIVAGLMQLIPVSWSANSIIRDFYNPLLPDARRQTLFAMASAGLEILGMILTVAGWLGVMVACCLPMWRVAAYIGQNIVITQIVWEGLWMSCVVQSTGQMHCRVYDSMLGLPDDLQASRALTVVSTLLGVLGMALAVAGAKCTNCTSDAANKPRFMLAAGVTFVTCGLLLLVAVCWTANGIILDFHNPLLEETQKREFGNSLYFGWGASCLLILGGAILSCSCSSKAQNNAVPTRVDYSGVKSMSANGYDRRDYV
ncbi:claudin-3-like [Puntigrus tetrazona]|uniref:claudin-3-like n=1 Tax=Puntigrus tetrazona TaxID=1606681 RepID=UPI001C8A6CDB|nr:claudin-3-like [Puntigrus tetrazona]